MTKPTISIERTMNAPAERIYKAFLDPATLKKYYAPPGTETIFRAFNAKVGGVGTYDFKGKRGAMTFEVKFLELSEFTKIRHTYVMKGMDADMEIQISLKEEGGRTLVRFEQWGLPAMIPADGAKAGWIGMMDRLKTLVET
jgi:uncharacterized protein YndB with AHSA1/START domain